MNNNDPQRQSDQGLITPSDAGMGHRGATISDSSPGLNLPPGTPYPRTPSSSGAFPVATPTPTPLGGTIMDSTGGGGAAAGSRLVYLRQLGAGGMGYVHLAVDFARGGRFVAVKRMLPEIARDERARQRFFAEAETMLELRHTYIVPVFDVQEDEAGPFIVMHYVEGPGGDWPEEYPWLNQLPQLPGPPLTLHDQIQGKHVYTEKDSIKLGLELLSALEYAHQRKRIHRDIKPANIMIDKSGSPMVADFGLVRNLESESKTRVGQAMFSAGWGAPEQQMDASTADHRADIFAVGAVLYFASTGRHPLEYSESQIPARLRSVVARAMDRDREARFQSAFEFRVALDGLLHERSPSTPAQPLQQVVNATAKVLSIQPFRFQRGDAKSLDELIRLADANPDEARDYLYAGNFSDWIARELGDAFLAKRGRDIAAHYGSNRAAGLEIFIREICERLGRVAVPDISPQPAVLDFGEMPLGSSRERSFNIAITGKERPGRAYLWGNITSPAKAKQLHFPSHFDGIAKPISVKIDASGIALGDYEHELLIGVAGSEVSCRVSVRYTVTKLKVSLDPEVMDFGMISAGSISHQRKLWITVEPVSGKLNGSFVKETGNPLEHAVQMSEEPFYQDKHEVDVTLYTKTLRPGKDYHMPMKLSSRHLGDFDFVVCAKTHMAYGRFLIWSIFMPVVCVAILPAVMREMFYNSPPGQMDFLASDLFTMGLASKADGWVFFSIFVGLVLGTFVGLWHGRARTFVGRIALPLIILIGGLVFTFGVN